MTPPTRRFFTLDVFTTERFAGNPLAVVLDADGLETETMQRIAREFNLSETVFVFPPEDRAHRARLRIFTPARELPFAGHPTVGTAVLLSIIDGRAGTSEFVMEEKVGAVPCVVRQERAGTAHATFDLPRLPSREDAARDRGAMASALGLAPADLGFDDWPAEVWSAGNPFTYVPLKNVDAIRRCRVNLATFDDAFRSAGAPGAFVFSKETADRANDFHARMFAPGIGPIEDPATGSAVAAFAGYLAGRGRYKNGEHVVRVEQGFEMGRPSLIELRMTVDGTHVTQASIAGSAVVVCEGRL